MVQWLGGKLVNKIFGGTLYMYVKCVITNATTCTLYTVHVSSCFVKKIEIKSLLTQLHVLNFI